MGVWAGPAPLRPAAKHPASLFQVPWAVAHFGVPQIAMCSPATSHCSHLIRTLVLLCEGPNPSSVASSLLPLQWPCFHMSPAALGFGLGCVFSWDKLAHIFSRVDDDRETQSSFILNTCCLFLTLFGNLLWLPPH